MDRKRFVLILADPEDEHALYVKGLLTDEKHVVRILDTSRFPSDFALSYGPQSNSARIDFDDGPILDWNDIHSIYWRQFTGVAESTLPDAQQACIAENDSRSLVESMLFALPGKWVNPYRAWRMHQVTADSSRTGSSARCSIRARVTRRARNWDCPAAGPWCSSSGT